MKKAFKKERTTRVNAYAKRLLRSLISRVSKKNTTPKRAINIVDRSLYSEWSRHFPINEKKAVRKAIKLGEENYDGYILHRCEPNGYSVTFWKFKAQVGAGKTRIMIPESLLLSSLLNNNEAGTFQTSDGILFVAKENGKTHSALKTKLLNSIEEFASGLGIKRIRPSAESGNDYALAVLRNLKFLTSFIQWGGRKGISPTRLLIPSIILVTLYFAGTSLLLRNQLSTVEEQYQANSGELQSALAVQERFNESKEKLDTLLRVEQELVTSFPIWSVVKTLYEMENVAVRRITLVEDNLFEIFGQGERATDVLRRVNEINGVSASFNRPVTSRRDGEIFSIELRLNYDQMAKTIASDSLPVKDKADE